jgi:hypothetical protein
MRFPTAATSLVFFCVTNLFAQEQSAPTPPEKPSLVGRMLHPFRATPTAPAYRDARLRGLVLAVELPPGPVKLSETRQLQVSVTLTNVGKRAVELDFPTEQRIEIYLRNSSDKILTRWSDNRAFAEAVATVLINPQERVEYVETIATRDLAPNKVFVAEVLFPAYPELNARRKFLTAP